MTLCSLMSGAWIMCSAGSRPWDKGGPGHPDSDLGPQFDPKVRGVDPPPSPSPGSATAGGENTALIKQWLLWTLNSALISSYGLFLLCRSCSFKICHLHVYTYVCTHNSWKDKVEIFLESYIGKAKRTLSKTASFSRLNFQGLQKRVGKSGGGYCILIVACMVTCFQRAGDEATTLKPTPPIYLALTASLGRTKVANLVLRVFSLIKIAAATIWKTPGVEI